MLSNDQREHIKSLLRPMQIIVFALFMGLMTFLVVIVAMRLGTPPDGQAGPPREPFLSYIAIIAAFVAPVAAVFVPRLVAASMRQAIVDGKPMTDMGMPHASEELRQVHPLVAMYQTTLIIGCGILEGAAFFNAVVFMLERQQMNLIAAAVLAVLILVQFPTGGRLVSWVEDELNNIDRLRSMR